MKLLTLAFALAACGGTKAPAPATPPPPPATTTTESITTTESGPDGQKIEKTETTKTVVPAP